MFALLLLLVLTGIFLFAGHNRVNNFFDKLDDRAINVAQFYLAEDNLSKENFKSVIKKFPQSLAGENIRIYTDHYQPKFIPEDSVHWDQNVLKQVIEQKKIHFSKENRQITGIYYVDNSGNFIVIVSAIDEAGYHYLHDLSLVMIFFFMASLLITFFIGKIFSKIALHPIVNITGNLKRIRASSLDLRLPVGENKTDEIDNLSLSINKLLEHLEQSFESQQSFIANASHELRTPITTILGEAETTLFHERPKEEYQLTLVNIIKETEGLNEIINSLMDLMQMDLAHYELQSVRMDELLWEIVDELDNDQVKIDYNIPNDRLKCTIMGNRRLLFIGINNVIKNAVKFSDGKEVFCELFCNETGINIKIRDQGIGMTQKDVLNIFQPFFRASNALNYAGHGIGLSLTQNVLKYHNGIIIVNSSVDTGTEFHLIFPN
ncbi:sensor histidine kinase [Mucilaginibacter sp. E4BP6]|uniref:sensor histidine kinase n=1 Tax=Mucilaginibacter sp. E4BP6 TaxID=2723089 RepID=UPI0015CAFD79|nr:HAMP domain-containing sensor histidine kinase [Mucilaginibacter sp. E4BP6]NYE66479.1 signal transduction histidine kinase [Mucilaginibacter sp. E4BP6]